MRTRCQDTQAGSNEEEKGARRGETSFTDGRRSASSVGGTGAGHSIAGRTTLFHIRGVRVEHVAINNLLRREGRSAGIRSRAILSRRFSSPSSSSSAVFSLFLSCDPSPSPSLFPFCSPFSLIRSVSSLFSPFGQTRSFTHDNVTLSAVVAAERRNNQ